jgi:hypothetical protein
VLLDESLFVGDDQRKISDAELLRDAELRGLSLRQGAGKQDRGHDRSGRKRFCRNHLGDFPGVNGVSLDELIHSVTAISKDSRSAHDNAGSAVGTSLLQTRL